MRVATVVVLLVCGTVAGLLAYNTPESMVAQSDTVVVGTIVSGTYSGAGAFFNLRVDRPLKGAVHAGQMLDVSWEHRETRLRGEISIANERGVFFLTDQGERWTVVPLHGGHAPFERRYFSLSKSSVTAAASEEWSFGNTVIEKIASELSASIDQCEQSRRLDEVFISESLMKLENRDLQRRIKARLSASGCTNSRIVAYLLAVSSGEPGAWTQLAGHIHDIKNTQFIGIVLSLAHSCRGASPDDVHALGRLATSDIQGLNSSATRALEAIHTREAVPFLAELLSSPDAQIRLKAIRGLSLFVDSLPVMTADAAQSMAYLQPPGKGLYRTTETDKFSASRQLPNAEKAPSYVEFWKKWWESMKREFGN
ncbi:MAG: HEAT repeat domain-containing protein [Bryobacteraceae bacterium]